MAGLETPKQRARQAEIASAFLAHRPDLAFEMLPQFCDVDIHIFRGVEVVGFAECRDNSGSIRFRQHDTYKCDAPKWVKFLQYNEAIPGFFLVAFKDGLYYLTRKAVWVRERVMGRDRRAIDKKLTYEFPWDQFLPFGA